VSELFRNCGSLDVSHNYRTSRPLREREREREREIERYREIVSLDFNVYVDI
jgi:hypothetical protein